MTETSQEEQPLLVRTECLRVSNRDRKFMERIFKRIEWLDKRITESQSKGKDLSFDKAEISALQWAVQYIEDADTVHFLLDSWILEELEKQRKEILDEVEKRIVGNIIIEQRKILEEMRKK